MPRLQGQGASVSHSTHRRRDHFRGIRLYAEEDAQLQSAADLLHTTVPELIRAVMFNRPLQQRPRCTAKHPSCTHHHKDLVDGYRDQQHRERLAVEKLTGAHHGDMQHWRATGGRLTTFGDWLRAHKISAEEEEQRDETG